MNVEALRVFNSPCGSRKVDGKAARVKFSIPLTIIIKIQITSFHYLTPLILVTKIECVYFITIQLKKHLLHSRL
jgi:hypothetical protein